MIRRSFMRSVVRRLVFTAFAGSLVLMWSAHHLAAQRGLPITMTRLYTGPDGQAHAEKTEVKLRPSTLRAGLDESEPLKVSGAQFFRWPPGYVWEWHTAKQRQYVITVSGRGEIELAGGTKILLNPGQIVLADDATGKGHTTRSIGSEDLVLLIVPFAAQ
jgi:quercetin dioxygenase-like cupin family protein